MKCHVVNLQLGLGGAEVYTLFFVRALLDLDCQVTLHAHPDARHWATLDHPRLSIEHAADSDALIEHLPAARQWIITHAPVSQEFADIARPRHLLTGFCHMPLAGRQPGVLAGYAQVYAVSNYVIETARAAGLANIDPEPCYGMVDFQRYAEGGGPIVPGPLYSWDRRKFRDRFYGVLEGLAAPLARAAPHLRFSASARASPWASSPASGRSSSSTACSGSSHRYSPLNRGCAWKYSAGAATAR